VLASLSCMTRAMKMRACGAAAQVIFCILTHTVSGSLPHDVTKVATKQVTVSNDWPVCERYWRGAMRRGKGIGYSCAGGRMYWL